MLSNNMKQIVLACMCLCAAIGAGAQTTAGMAAYYNFDQAATDVTGNTANAGFFQIPPQYGCGVSAESITFRGGDGYMRVGGPAKEEFDTENFTVAFYFRVNNNDGIQYLFTKRRKDCLADNSFYIRYRPSTRNINVVLTESSDRFVNIVHELPLGTCWYHIAVVRDAGTVRLFVNGLLVREQSTFGRLDLRNDGDILIGGSECYGANEVPFRGAMDELRIYSRALNRFDVQGLLLTQPDRIATQDTIVFVNNSVNLRLSPTCGTTFRWSPAANLTNANSANPRFEATQGGNYLVTVQIGDAMSTCVASDSVRITVIDPNTLDCKEVFLPKAFTPNRDGLNDTYGISNPYAIQQLLSFEIFDRWGSKVFATADAFEQWDGTFMGKALNPGVMVYRVQFICNGEEKISTGTFVIMK